MFGPELNKHHRFVGCIDQHCNVVHILKDAYDDAKLLCDHYYADSPDLRISLANGRFILPPFYPRFRDFLCFYVLCCFYSDVNGVIEFVYVPSHLYHILFELLKVNLTVYG